MIRLRRFKTFCLSLLFLIVSWIGFLPPASAATLAPNISLGGLSPAPLISYLPPGNAITDGGALLRYALPIDNDEIRKIQGDLEGLSEWLRSKRWGPIKKDVTKVERVLSRDRDRILAAVPTDRQGRAAALLDSLAAGLEPLREAAGNQDREGVWQARADLLKQVTQIEELMVTEYPFAVPQEYSDLPQLKGRAAVEFMTSQGGPITVVVDGYSAPVTAGNFIDLVNRGFYDGLPFIRAEDFYVLQTGDPEGPAEGFIDPKTDEYRAIPLEILVEGDDAPLYGVTLEEIGRFMDSPVLPFQAYGTVAMARPESDKNGASSQFFFFLFDAALTPAGLNLLDGRYAVFGYAVEGDEVLGKLGQGDRIESAKVVSGMENFVPPQSA
ncbi:peptidylprolyl isomerase [Romeria aff. gracilis LEGE 07310]|uniref:peptidylprolyl isomerase n=1 Tax=Vasconcelosia minhoensis LEGE 07310 TaxID=915328 RepID=A0A8J7DBJ0_9CYAN|nr:peptidylprolyl isomerase [Romeria gracilis]MBE9077797.1 peptidylprolyl isomerase [Romeria aff. gracilis LEGE 07310]